MKRKTGYGAAVLVLSLVLAMSSGCGKKETKYTYRAAGIEALNAGNYEAALESFDQAIQSSKGLVGKFEKDVLKYRGEAQYLSEDYASAADTYGILIQIDGEQAEYFNMRAAARAGAGSFAGAAEDYEKSVSLDPEGKAPGSLEALMAAGEAMEQAGETGQAMALYESALSKGKQSAGLYNRMGMCKMAEEDWTGADGYFELGLSMPDSSQVPELLFNRAIAKEYSGDFKTALDLMQQYVSVHGPDEAAEREITFLKTR
ncbi:tetratricopeptide repeat protein [Lacrimispora sp.]|uniref:tetratricopeptide repeat protein n=1 Tax=Lacrimispora sp. TaxID=2719234 RepID=UPI0034612C64